MPSHDVIKAGEANEAAWEAGKGGLIGAAKWGTAAAVLGAVAYGWSPVYRSTTIQFKVLGRMTSAALAIAHSRSRYIQMSGMVLGGMIEGDSRLRQFENQIRMQKRWQREKAKWQRYEEEFGGKDDK